MNYESSRIAVVIFFAFVGSVLGLSFYLGKRAKSAQGYFAAHGQIHWFVNGVAFAGDYLSAASFLGICGMIATSGYDGFLYSIGFLAGWIVALFVIAEPLKSLGKYTFADALDSRFHSRGIKLAAGVSALVVSIFYLIPQMSGAGSLITPLLGFNHTVGVLLVGVTVTLIVVTAGMVSTTWVQFIKGSMLVFFCAILTLMILNRGYRTDPGTPEMPFHVFQVRAEGEVVAQEGWTRLPEEGGWKGQPYVRMKEEKTGRVTTWKRVDAKFVAQVQTAETGAGLPMLAEAQTIFVGKDKQKIVNGLPQGKDADLYPVGHIARLPGGKTETGPLGPAEFFSTLDGSTVILWSKQTIEDESGKTTVYFQVPTPGHELLLPGGGKFKGLREEGFTWAKVDFLSLMLALFCGTASLPHILIRYYTVKDRAAARKSTIVGIGSIGFFYILTVFLGLGAMTSGTLDFTDYNMSAPLLAKRFGELPFAIISAIAFTTVLGTVSGLIMAASGAVAHDIMANYMGIQMNDTEKVRAGKAVAVVVGIVAMALGIVFKSFNVGFLVGWAFNIAASANLPALVMLLFWKGTTKQGITVSILVGMISSLAWVMVSAETFEGVYGYTKAEAAKATLVPFGQPGIVTIPLGFLVLIVVSLLTRKTGTAAAIKARMDAGAAGA